MLKRLFLSVVLIASLTTKIFAEEKPMLIFYCGITMVKPITVISKIIEKKYNCDIKIMQGGSGDLYKSLKISQKGDLYLPGSQSYRTKHLSEGLLLDSTYIGFNQAAIFVQKGNPKGIKHLEDLANEKFATMICDPKSGSIGKQTKQILIKFKDEDFFNNVFDQAVEIGTDSRNINSALKNKKIDMAINWRATAFWPENSPYIDIIPIDEKYAPKNKLVINLLKFSQHPEIAKALMEYAASKDGQDIMKKYGFLE